MPESFNDHVRALEASEARQAHFEGEAAIASRYSKRTPRELLSMWQTGKGLDGKALRGDDFEAVGEAYLAKTGTLLPDLPAHDDAATIHVQPSAPAIPQTRQWLTVAEVTEIYGPSRATLQRRADPRNEHYDPAFPEPRKHVYPYRYSREELDRFYAGQERKPKR